MKQASVATCCHAVLVVVLAMALSTGCGRRPKNVSDVTGTVTLDGQPLADALVTFTPASSGTSSAAKTDSSGKYELIYTKGVKGAAQGEHTVTITTYQVADDGADPPTAEVPEKVPYAYREGEKELKATVNAGKNEINFSLEAGPVSPPQVKGKKTAKASSDRCY